MKITLNDEEIRKALIEYIASKTFDVVAPSPGDCWFEAKAGLIDGDDISVIHDVEFIFDGTMEPDA